jgi:hypothetical protein
LKASSRTNGIPIMAEVNGGVPQTNGHPPASPPSLLRTAPSQPAPITISDPTIPLTSLQDNSLNKSPRNARLMHMLLFSLGCTAYQERVPLQLLDFAYRHSSYSLRCSTSLVRRLYLATKRAQGTPLLVADSEKLMDKLAQMRSCWRFKVGCNRWEWRSQIEQRVFVGDGTAEE